MKTNTLCAVCLCSIVVLSSQAQVMLNTYDSSGNIKPADLVYLSLSFDHRILDGAVAAAFCNAMMRHLQNPAVLLLPENLG